MGGRQKARAMLRNPSYTASADFGNAAFARLHVPSTAQGAVSTPPLPLKVKSRTEEVKPLGRRSQGHRLLVGQKDIRAGCSLGTRACPLSRASIPQTGKQARTASHSPGMSCLSCSVTTVCAGQALSGRFL